jgi:hypothetical protein
MIGVFLPLTVKKSRSLFVLADCNRGKQSALHALHAEYLRYLRACIDRLIEARQCSIPKRDLRSFFPQEETLSTNIVICVQNHAVEIATGWFRSCYSLRLKREIGRLFREGLIDEAFRKQLYVVGKCGVSKPSAKIGQEAIDFYWSMLLDPAVGGRPPAISERVGMRMSVHTSDLRKVERIKLTQWWLGFSGLLRGRRVQLPLSANPFVRSKEDVTHGCLVRRDRKGRWKVEVLERLETDEPRVVAGAPRVAVDVGLNVLAATSDGRVYGRGVKHTFDARYAQVKRVRANRQRQGFKENSARLDRLEDRLSGLVKTATGTIANKLVKAYPEHVFVLEDLDMRGCRGQKRFAYRALQASLAGKAPTLKVNPAYTSQECPSCHYVSRGNRKGTSFRCLSCGRLSHADVVGAVNLLRRSEDHQVDCDSLPSEVKAFLLARWPLRGRAGSKIGNTALRAGNQRLTAHHARKGSVGIAPNAEVNTIA